MDVLPTSVQHFFNYLQGIINSIFSSNLLPKFCGFLLDLRVIQPKAYDFLQTPGSQLLVPNRLCTCSQCCNPFSPKVLVKYKRHNTGWYASAKTEGSCAGTAMMN